MKRIISALIVVLFISPAVFAQALSPSEWTKKNHPLVYQGFKESMEKSLAEWTEKIFISNVYDPKLESYIGERPVPFNETEFVDITGINVARYFVPEGFTLKNEYVGEEKREETRMFYLQRFYAHHFTNGVHARLNGSEYGFKINIPTPGLALSNPSRKAMDLRGKGNISEEDRRAMISNVLKKPIKPTGEFYPQNDKGLEKVLIIEYSPKYFSELKILYGDAMIDCLTPELKAKGINKCDLFPVETISNGNLKVSFYLMPKWGALAKDLKFIKEEIASAIEETEKK